MVRKDTPFKPLIIDTCKDGCYAFPDKEEMTCPICFEPRYYIENSIMKPQKTIKQLEVAPQIASLFTNTQFLNQCEKSIDSIIKGSHIKELKEKHGLFEGKYDIALIMFNDGFQTHSRGGVKLNTIQLHILNLPEEERYTFILIIMK